MTPTREQLEAARSYLARMAKNSAYPPGTCEAIATLLAATVEPNEEELREEAARWAGVEGHGASGRAARAGYTAGARREGRR